MGGIKQKDINLLAALEKTEAKTRSSARPNVLPLLVLVVVVVGLGAYWFAQDKGSADLRLQKAEIESYLNAPETVSQLQATQTALADAASMREAANAMEAVTKAVATHPDLTAQQIQKIFEVATDRATLDNFSYDRETGEFSFTAKTGTASGVALFVTQLRDTGLFADVSYGGYAGGTTEKVVQTNSEDGEAPKTETVTTSSYSFSVVCVVRAPEGV